MDVLGSFSNTLTSIMDMVSAATTPYVYVCMYVCMCVCVYVCTLYVYMYECKGLYVTPYISC